MLQPEEVSSDRLEIAHEWKPRGEGCAVLGGTVLV